ncbi:MAG: hypothetical protein IKM88_09495, partial [Lachnospiraceae bacterium]|nr:hypothetical protein [Lachnospiraceae bacterium]
MKFIYGDLNNKTELDKTVCVLHEKTEQFEVDVRRTSKYEKKPIMIVNAGIGMMLIFFGKNMITNTDHLSYGGLIFAVIAFAMIIYGLFWIANIREKCIKILKRLKSLCADLDKEDIFPCLQLEEKICHYEKNEIDFKLLVETTKDLTKITVMRESSRIESEDHVATFLNMESNGYTISNKTAHKLFPSPEVC